MLISCRWLARHVDLSGISPQELASELSLSTAEVEGVHRFAPHLSDLTVGHVVERAKHPDADKLSVCRVDLGGGELATIVCGAPNIAAGQRVAVATPGTVLPGELRIKKSKIRGVESQGMICSLRELGLGEEHDGIWVLPGMPGVGDRVAAALGMEDWVLEIDNKSLTHRPDCWGHRGIAGEVAAIFRRELLPIDLAMPRTGNGDPYPVRIESRDCSRYLALAIDGARPLPSPDWLRWLLLAVGQRPADQLVDVSNFVMLDIGQPTHVFDRRRLSAAGIEVRNARAGETMRTLDGVERALLPADLLICSGGRPVALAGVMGGEESKVTGESAELLLESANFQHAVVRRTAMRLGLRTDASARFEKGLDPLRAAEGAAHFARTLLSLQPTVVFPAPPTDAGSWTDPAHTLGLRPGRARSLLGAQVPDEEIADILRRLRLPAARKGDHFEVAIPAARATKDLTIEADLIEEVGRIHRYGAIPERALVGTIAPPARDERRRLVRRIQDRLSGAARFHEALSYSFQSDELLAKLGLAALPHVRLVNPVVESEARVRRSIAPGLLARIEPNRRHRSDVRLFEIGKGYLPERASERGEPAEAHELAVVWAGPPPEDGARFDASRFHRLHGALVDLFEHLALESPSWSAASEAPPWMHPTRRLAARWGENGPDAVLLGELEPAVARDLGLAGELVSDVAVAIVSIDALLQAPPRAGGYRPIPRFPPTKVDVAVAIGDEVPAGTVLAAIRKAGRDELHEAELFDLYRGASLGAGRKSLAFHLMLCSDARTLGDEDVAKLLARLERALGEIGGELRSKA